MLVLSRKQGQSIIIGGTIRVVVVETRPGVVRLGIEAPKEISVHREEVQHAIDQETHRGSE